MTDRPMVIAGNWKMHKLRGDALDYAGELSAWVEDTLGDRAPNLQLVIAPAFTSLELLVEQNPPFGVFAQTMHQADHGAFTGEVSPAMLRDVGAHGVLLGHSERRAYYNETDEALREKVAAALEFRLRPMLCVGETIEQRQAGDAETVVERLRTALAEVDAAHAQAGHVYIAYEPVWAIGTGETATPEIAQQLHAHIRGVLGSLWGDTVADVVPILYGGSVKPDNAEELLGQADIDGALIGGAALEVSSFVQIAEAGLRCVERVGA